MPRYSCRTIAWVLLFLGTGAVAGAQSADFVSAYARQPAVSGAQTVYLLAVGSRALDPDAVFDPAALRNVTPEELDRFATDSPLSLAEFAFLVATFYDIRPSLMGRLVPGPRYALRDLRHERILLYEADARSPVPGEVALRTIRRAADLEERR